MIAPKLREKKGKLWKGLLPLRLRLVPKSIFFAIPQKVEKRQNEHVWGLWLTVLQSSYEVQRERFESFPPQIEKFYSLLYSILLRFTYISEKYLTKNAAR
jgi:hypothetical protein